MLRINDSNDASYHLSDKHVHDHHKHVMQRFADSSRPPQTMTGPLKDVVLYKANGTQQKGAIALQVNVELLFGSNISSIQLLLGKNCWDLLFGALVSAIPSVYQRTEGLSFSLMIFWKEFFGELNICQFSVVFLSKLYLPVLMNDFSIKLF